MIIVSACLAGVNCKYDGGNNINEKILELVREGKAILVCPEQLGGLTTPREPAEIINNDKNDCIRVVNKIGQDITKEFIKGAEETLKIAKSVNAKTAILKARSPSCGFGEIYDGTFKGRIIEGIGLTSLLLSKNNIKIYTEEDLTEQILKDLD